MAIKQINVDLIRIAEDGFLDVATKIITTEGSLATSSFRFKIRANKEFERLTAELADSIREEIKATFDPEPRKKLDLAS